MEIDQNMEHSWQVSMIKYSVLERWAKMRYDGTLEWT